MDKEKHNALEKYIKMFQEKLHISNTARKIVDFFFFFEKSSVKINVLQGAFFPLPPTGRVTEAAWFALGQEFVKLGHE